MSQKKKKGNIKHKVDTNLPKIKEAEFKDRIFVYEVVLWQLMFVPLPFILVPREESFSHEENREHRKKTHQID